jgi:putative tricarboxylic transport membrane protein
MRFDDTFIGLFLAVCSVGIFVIAQTFPPIPGQSFGASLFPTVLSVGLFICSVLLLVQGLRQRAAGAARPGWPAWTREPISILRFLLVPGSLFFYFWRELAAVECGGRDQRAGDSFHVLQHFACAPALGTA